MHSIDVARFQAEHSLSPSKRGPKPSEAVHEHYRRIVNSVKCTVTVIVGDADEVRKSDERRKIVAALKAARTNSVPKVIADLTGMKAVNVRVLLGKMMTSGEICQPRLGFYAATSPKTQK
jgi:hypothetical protein